MLYVISQMLYIKECNNVLNFQFFQYKYITYKKLYTKITI